MRYTTNKKRTLAILLAAVMATSVFAMGFIGGAAAATQNIDEIDIPDDDELNVGEDGIEQTIELEKVQIDTDGGDVTVTAEDAAGDFNGDNFNFDGDEENYEVESFELHDTGGVTGDLDQESDVSSNSDISVSVDDVGDGSGDNELTITFGDNAESETVNLDLTVSLDLESYEIQNDDLDAADEIEYTAAAEAGSTDTATFDLLPPEPELDSAEVSEDYPSWVEVSTESEDIQVTDNADAVEAFDIDDSEYDNVNEILDVVEDSEDTDGLPDVATGDDEIALVLDGFVTSEEDELVEDAISYDPSEGGVAHADNSNVQPTEADLDLDDDLAPTMISATVGDSAENVDSEDPNEVIQVQFSEDVELPDESNLEDLASEFENVDSTNVINDDADAIDIEDDVVTITLDSAVEPDADLRSQLNAPASDDFVHLESALGDTGAAEIDDRDVENNVAPVVDSAEFGPDEDNLPSELEVTFDDLDSSVSVEDVDENEFTIDGAESDVEIDSVEGVSGDTVTLTLDPVAEVADDDVEVGHTGNDGDLESNSPFSATQVAESSVDPADNDVEPVFTDIELNQNSLDEIDVTFTEDVEIVDEDSNVFATDSFDITGPGEVHQGEVDGDTLTLTLEEPLDADTEEELSFANGDGEGDLVSAADSDADVQGFNGEEIVSTALVQSLEVTYSPDGDAGEGTYDIELEFNNNIDLEKDGTVSQVADAFTADADEAAIPDPDEEGESITVNEGDSTIIFEGVEETTLDPGVGLASGGDGLVYDNSGDYITDDGESIASFDKTIDNQIVPVIDEDSVSINDDGELTVQFSEELDNPGAEQDIIDAFDVGVTIEGVDSFSDSNSEVTLELEEAPDGDFDPADELTYTADDQALVATADDTVLAEEGPLTVSIVDEASDRGLIEKVVFDDVEANNDDNADGEMIVYFQEGVTTSDQSGTDSEPGLIFDSDSTDVDIEIANDADVDNEPDGTDLDNVSVVPFEADSDSESVASTVNPGDEFGDDAELIVDDPEQIDIEVEDQPIISDQTVESEDIHQHVAGDLEDVESTDIDVELIGTQEDEKSNAYITVTAPTDEEGVPVINHDFELDVEGFDESSLNIDSLDKEDDLRFDGEFTVDVSAVLGDADEQDGATEGETVDVDVADATVDHKDNVSYVHSALTTATDSYELTSQPMPGEIETGEDIGDVTYWEANSSDFETYDDEDQVAAVHYGLWIDSDEAGAEYGFVFDDDRDTRTNIGTLNLEEGWHVVGSNYNITQNSDIEVQDDLSISGDVNSTDVAVQRADLPGTTLDGDAAIEQYEGYYVFLHEDENRPIVLPEFDGSIE